MTNTACASAALDGIIAPLATKIAAFLGAIVETILAIAENVCNTLRELGACCRKAGRRRPGLSRSMMLKLGFLPPSASALHAIACKRSPNDGSAWQERGPESERRWPGPQLPRSCPNSMTILEAAGMPPRKERTGLANW